MMHVFRGAGLAATLPLLTVCASAQQAPTAKETVEVTGRRPAVQNLVDRQSYAIEHDLQGATGSISDVLKNLPSIDIDALGGLSLRGDPNVTILIDGKKSPLLLAAGLMPWSRFQRTPSTALRSLPIPRRSSKPKARAASSTSSPRRRASRGIPALSASIWVMTGGPMPHSRAPRSSVNSA